MKKIGWFSGLFHPPLRAAMIQRVAGAVGVVALLMMAGTASAQTQGAQIVSTTPPVAPQGYTVHESIYLGGHMVGLSGSGAMYNTMVNMQSGPRVLGETFDMRALPSNKHSLFDALSAFSNGIGGDPNNYASLNLYKGKIYQFSGNFRRDRQYFDYNLLGNPNIPSGQSIPIGPSTAPTGSFPWPQVKQSPFLYNTVRRMTNTNLTLFPLSKVTFRAGYSQNIFQGPSLSPSGYQFGGSYSVLLQEMQRNSTDDFMGGIDWKPVRDTKLTFEEHVDHYKGDSYFTLNPAALLVQEAGGAKVAFLTNYFNLTPYSSSACNANGGTILSPPQSPNGLPIINPACAVASSYLRSQPTRVIFPTEIFRFESTSLKNVVMNGDVRYTDANMSLPNYYENFQGLTTASSKAPAYRELQYTASGSAKRKVTAADFGIVWQTTPDFSFAEQLTFSNAQQPGTTTMTSETTAATPSTDQTITYPGALIVTKSATGASTFEGSGAVGVPLPGFFGQKLFINRLTASWDATARATFAITYRYGLHVIAEGIPHSDPLAPGATNNGTVTIHENGGVFHAALRPTSNWDIDGSVEILAFDNAFTPMDPRQLKVYNVHTMYRPKSWATVTAVFNDRELHNNTNNTGTASPTGPLDHVAHTRAVSLGAELFPNQHYGLTFNYTYTDVYMAGNICYDAAASPAFPGAAPASGALCPGATVRGTNYYEFGPVRNFEDAPTNTGLVAFTVSPRKSIRSNIGYNINSVDGSRFYNDARDVAGSLVNTYQSPFVNIAWTSRPGITWRAEYNFYGYGEGGPSGAPYCSTSNPTLASPTVPVVPCNSPSLAGTQTGLTISPAGETLPRNFHANIVTLGVHYEF